MKAWEWTLKRGDAMYACGGTDIAYNGGSRSSHMKEFVKMEVHSLHTVYFSIT